MRNEIYITKRGQNRSYQTNEIREKTNAILRKHTLFHPTRSETYQFLREV